ncbi:hypothetical protein SXCC_04438 [Gluconacetobacter sp. SXCC-1]|nr:hypothetical protein SXCC_04438 [Gluconacetobacter sp. SXCC-1]
MAFPLGRVKPSGVARACLAIPYHVRGSRKIILRSVSVP